MIVKKSASMSFLPYGRQTIEPDDLEAVSTALVSDYLTTGPLVQAFEQSFAQATGAKYAVACSNGTAALHLAALALNLGEGDAVIVPTVTFLATANAARFVGAEVVFADVDPLTGLMRPEHLEAALARCGGLRARAVFPVHLNGPPVDTAAIKKIADREGLAVVEDGCHALGGDHLAQGNRDCDRVGSCPDSVMTTFSFHAVKTIAMGEGGAITTNRDDLRDRLALLRNHGLVRDPKSFVRSENANEGGQTAPWYYEMQEYGFNYRVTDIQCALGSSQLAKLDRFTARRQFLIDRYSKFFPPDHPHIRLVSRTSQARVGWHLCVVLIDFKAIGVSRTIVMERLKGRGIGSQVHYIPVHRQPYYETRYGELKLPGADAYYDKCLSLPLFPAMADDDPERVVAALLHAVS